MQKKGIEKAKKVIEAKFLDITKAMGKRQQELSQLNEEKLRLEGEYRLWEKFQEPEVKKIEKK